MFAWIMPVLLYYAVSLPVNALLGFFLAQPWLENVSIAVTGAVLIPLFLYMIRQDAGKEQAAKEAQAVQTLMFRRGLSAAEYDTSAEADGADSKGEAGTNRPPRTGQAAAGTNRPPRTGQTAADTSRPPQTAQAAAGTNRSPQTAQTAAGTARLLTALSLPAGMFLSWTGGYLMEFSGIYEHFSNQTQENMLAAPLWLQLLVLVIISPVMEELLYRGLVYRRLSRHIPWWAAMLISAGCFALGHGNMIQIVYAFPLALLLTLDYRYAGTLAAPVLMHMGANLLTVLLTQM